MVEAQEFGTLGVSILVLVEVGFKHLHSPVRRYKKPGVSILVLVEVGFKLINSCSLTKEELVSILVLVEVGFKPESGFLFYLRFNYVSILVLVEVGFKPVATLYLNMPTDCFNPCLSGSGF